MQTKLERARQLREEALERVDTHRDIASVALPNHTAEERKRHFAYWNGCADEYALEAEMYGDLIAKYEGLSEETI